MSNPKCGELWSFSGLFATVTDIDGFAISVNRNSYIKLMSSTLGIALGEQRNVCPNEREIQRWSRFLIDGVKLWIPTSLVEDRGTNITKK